MTFAQLFNLAGLYVVPFWLSMILLPQWNITKKVMGSTFIFLPLALLYAYYFVASFDLETAKALAVPQLDVFAQILSQWGPAGSTWVHILVMDLFIGRWIYWQGQEKKIWTRHSLILCPFFGPIGLLSHIITDALFGNNSPNGAESNFDSDVDRSMDD